MKRRNLPQLVNIDGIADFNAHCPICGMDVLAAIQWNSNHPPCPHLAFVYAEALGQLEYQSDSHKERMAKIDSDGLQRGDRQVWLQLLADAGYSCFLMILEETRYGHCCGPMSMTLGFGFDFLTVERSRPTIALPARVT